MDADLDSLETKVVQIVSLCERLRTENDDLRRQLTEVASRAEHLSTRLAGARSGIERLIARLPG